MKKILGFALAALVAFGAIGAVAEGAQDVALGGVVTEVADGSMIFNTEAYGDVRVEYDETTEMVGLEDGIQAGTYVIVDYSGAMTRSVPPQIFATKISMFVVLGTVVGVSDAGLLVEQADQQQILVHLQDGMAPLYFGCPVDVYYSGIMAMSEPGQITALYIVTPTLEGMITERGDGYFMMSATDGQAYMVNNDDGTHVDAALNVGDEISVYYTGTATKSEPPQIYAIAVFHETKAE